MTTKTRKPAKPKTPAGEDRSLIVPTDIRTVMTENYREYAMAVVISRALPDVRDGLKPVHRRILFSMGETGNTHDKPYRKSARAVGDVMGKYHPHGDSAIYDAMARLTQSWSVTAPLIDGQGNFGSPDGDNPAAMRYTEARLAPISQFLLTGIKRDTVDFRPNYDEKELEPVVLPAAFPQVLVNGGSGIAVGMASSIPTHNLREVIAATLLRMNDPHCDLDTMMSCLPAPDFPTGGRIVGIEGVRRAYETGRGTLELEAHMDVETHGGAPVLVYSDIPYGVSKTSIVARINELIEAKKLAEVVSARDESDRRGVRFTVELKKGADPDIADKRLKSFTDLRASISLNFTAVDGHGVPREMGLGDILDEWISFRRTTVRRLTAFDLRQARARGRLILGRIAALSMIDKIIKLIKAAKDQDEARQSLMALTFAREEFSDLVDLLGTPDQQKGKRFGLTPEQAEDILAMRLRRLTGLERDKLEAEGREIAALARSLQDILNSPEKLDAVIREELEKISREHGQDRMTEVAADAVVEKLDTRTIAEPLETCTVEILPDGRMQRWSKIKSLEEVQTSRLIETDTHSRLMIVTDRGMSYSIDVSTLPRAEERKDEPRPLPGLLGFTPAGAPIFIESVSEDALRSIEDGGEVLTFVSADGMVRRTPAAEFASIPNAGKIAMKIGDKDPSIIAVLREGGAACGILLATAGGKVLRFALEDLRIFNGRTSRGVRGMKLDKDDTLASALLVPIETTTGEEIEAREADWLAGRGEPQDELVQVCASGHIRKSPLVSYRQMRRDGKGLNDRGPARTIGETVAMVLLPKGEGDILVQTGETLERLNSSDIRRGARATTGGKPFEEASGARRIDQ